MSALTLIDSSAWVEATRKDGDPQIVREVARLLHSGTAAMTEPVWMEVYRGIRGEREDEWFAASRALCVWLDFDANCWSEAGEVARLCQRSGVTVPLGDILVFSCAARYGVALLEQDKHFAIIALALEG